MVGSVSCPLMEVLPNPHGGFRAFFASKDNEVTTEAALDRIETAIGQSREHEAA